MFRPSTFPTAGAPTQLIRAGNLYLSLSDAIAMALENNIDVEVSRYGYPTDDAGLLSARPATARA